MSVREFGTIYEGLLESSLSLAETDLTFDNSGAWVPAGKDDEVVAPTGAIYFHTASGERKATAPTSHPRSSSTIWSSAPSFPCSLSTWSGLLPTSRRVTPSRQRREFFDFRVADLAMGSGHFLVAAVDKIEALMRTFLTEHTVPGIEELLRLSAVARDALGTDDVAKSEVDEVGLLRRQIARRCIYGLDINPMAVELACLALWIHTFVPGLPMSNLDHGLVSANSPHGDWDDRRGARCTAAGTQARRNLFIRRDLTDQLASAKTLLVDVANASERPTRPKSRKAQRLLTQAREAADTARQIFDAAVAARIGLIEPGLIPDELSLKRVLRRVGDPGAVDALKPAYMPHLFPEVFCAIGQA